MFTLFTMGSTIYFELFYRNDEQVTPLGREFRSYSLSYLGCQSPPLFSFSIFSIYMGAGLSIFIFPCDCLLVIITCFSGGYCLCHLTSCLILDACHLNSNIELMCDDITKVFSTYIRRTDAVVTSPVFGGQL